MLRCVLLTIGGIALVTFASREISAQQRSPYYGPRSTNSVYLTAWEEPPQDLDWVTVDPNQAVTQKDHYSSLGCCPGEIPGWYAGVELAIVKPYWEDEVDTIVTTTQSGDVEIMSTSQLDPDYDCSLSPRIYLGHRDCCGFGGRVRYWIYDDTANPLTTTTPIATESLNASLNVQALDVEATKLLSTGLFDMEFSGGVRYGRTEVEASLENMSIFDTRLFMGKATFEGIGPTISGAARHQLGQSCFSIVGNIRGSLLFGRSNITNNVAGGQFPQMLINEGQDDVVTVVDAQIGVEYAKRIGHGRLALRAMMESQWWGVATPGASFARELNQAVPSVDRFTTGRDLGFFGVTAGIIYTH